MNLTGTVFTLVHGGGATTYRAVRRHRDIGFYECVAIADGRDNSHRFKGQIQVLSYDDINAASKTPVNID